MAQWMEIFLSKRATDMAQHVDNLQRQLQCPTSVSVCGALRLSWEQLQSCNTGPSQQWAQVAVDYAWEKLNTGNWKDVSVIWREVFSTAVLLKTLCLVRSGETQRALVELDRGILLGAPIFNSVLQALATALATDMRMNPHSATEAEGKTDITTNSTDGNVSLKLESSAIDKTTDNSLGRRKKIAFRNYKPFKDSADNNESMFGGESKKVKVGMDVHNLASRTANVPVIDPARRIPLVYLPSLETFHRNNMLSSTPVVMSGVMDDWPAYSARKWR